MCQKYKYRIRPLEGKSFYVIEEPGPYGWERISGGSLYHTVLFAKLRVARLIRKERDLESRKTYYFE